MFYFCYNAVNMLLLSCKVSYFVINIGYLPDYNEIGVVRVALGDRIRSILDTVGAKNEASTTEVIF